MVERMEMSSFKSFASDNNSGIHPEILKAMVEVNIGNSKAYGEDEYTKAADKKFQEHFGEDIDAYFVFNGTAANALGLRAMTESYHSIICASTAHINVSECNAVEKFTGCKILTIPSSDGKITVEQVKKHMNVVGEQHSAQPKVISITQPTELGRVYLPEEIRALADFAHKNNMLLHMDGARLSNAAYSLNLDLKSITKDVGVDVLSFGGTKNGVMCVEAVILFNKQLSKNFKYIRKQGMQLASKMRFISAQFIALLSNDLWLRNAKHANEMAKLLSKEIERIKGIKISQPIETNAVFAIISPEYIPKLSEKYFFYIWNEEISEIRLMTSFDTTKEEILDFVSFLKDIMNSGTLPSPQMIL